MKADLDVGFEERDTKIGREQATMTEDLSTAAKSTPTPEEGESASSDRLQRIWKKLIFLPYFIGIVWTCLHPVVSVITGELKCRGWYLDEHAIEIKFAEVSSWDAPYHLKVASTLPKAPKRRATLCENLNESPTNLSCHVHGDHFHMSTVVPLSNTLDPTDEALVFVVPNPTTGDWTTSTFHHTLLNSLRRLANPIDTPWLAKTIVIVSPPQGQSLDATVSAFLDAYLGSRNTESSIPPLPPSLCGAILRTLIAFQVDDNSPTGVSRTQLAKEPPGKTEFSILPQGRRGVLPNLDLVFLIGKLFERAMFLSPNRYPESTFLAHGYTAQSQAVGAYLDTNAEQLGLTQESKTWLKGLTDLGLFAYSLAMGPYPPHAAALDRGIDSVTIRARFEGAYYRNPSVEMVQYWEYLVRALSNIHERLHHSYTLYLIPSPKMFVSHVEYILPNILVLLPLAIRAFGQILWNPHRANLPAITWSSLIAAGTFVISSVALASADMTSANTVLAGLYAACIYLWKSMVLDRRQNLEKSEVLQSLQFMACILAAYVLVPIAFSHTSLSYVPSLLWVPLLAFPSYSACGQGGVWKWIGLTIWVATAPPVLLVPHLFPGYTAFVRYVHVPLHAQLLLMVFTMFYP